MKSRIGYSNLFVLLVLLLPHAACAAAGGLPARVDTLEAAVANLQTTVNNLNSQLTTANANIATLQGQVSAWQSNGVLALNNYLTLGTHNGQPTAIFTGVNVQVVNGTGQTYGSPNGTGNLIVGYDTADLVGNEHCSDGSYPEEQSPCEAAGKTWASIHKSGSHNLVVGDSNNYSQSGGVVFGQLNTINRDYATVTGGYLNNASGQYASVSGGWFNRAGGNWASVSGGGSNRASGNTASVSGGGENTASGMTSSVSGGGGTGPCGNTASGDYSSVLGGCGKTASSFDSYFPGP